MSFADTKDRIWVGYNVFAGWLARQPMPVRKVGYGIFGLVLWIAYILPGNMVRPTIKALAVHMDLKSPTLFFRQFVKRFCLGVNRIEQVRHGRTDAIDAMLRIPERERLDQLLANGGCILAFPHTHSTLAMGRGLAREYPLMALVRTSAGDKRRALSELEICDNLGCEYLDVQHAKPTLVARKVLSALRDDRLVLGTVDRIKEAPSSDTPIDAATDTVRVMAFNQPVGIAGWPARFAFKAGVPIVPATVVQTADTLALHLGESVQPSEDVVETTQAWTSALEVLLRAHPEEWVFALDKHWSRTLRA